MNHISHWNYRVVAIPEGDDIWFEIVRVYYDEEDVAVALSRVPCIGGESMTELAKEFEKMSEAGEKDVLWSGDRFPEVYTQ